MEFRDLTLYANFGTPEMWNVPTSGAWALHYSTDGVWWLFTVAAPCKIITDDDAANLLNTHDLPY